MKSQKKRSRAVAKASTAAPSEATRTIKYEAIQEIKALLEPLARSSGLKFSIYETQPFTLEIKMFARAAEPVNENLMKQLALIDEMDAYRETLDRPEDPELAKAWKPIPWQETHAKEEEFWKAIEALQPKKGLVGRLIKFGVGDGYANYLITAEVGNKVEVCWIGTGDCWSWNGVDASSMIDRDIAAECVRREDAAKKLFGPKREKSE